MQKVTRITKLAAAKSGVIPAVVGMSLDACELVTHCLATDVLAVELSTARASLQ